MISPVDLGLPPKFTEFRSYPGFSQWKTASDIAASEKRISGVCAPPGCGKSVLNMTASRILDVPRTLYLTVNKPLQNQLMADFADSEIRLFNLVGHSAYPCTDRYFSDTDDLISVECAEGRETCPYWKDVETSLSRTHVCSNIANWVSVAKAGDPDRFGKFDLLILDEAHNLESLLCGLLSIKFSRRSVYDLIQWNLPESLEISEWITWAKDGLHLCERALTQSRRNDKLEGRGIESQHTKKLKRLLQNMETIADIEDEWVVETISSGAQLTPVFASNYAEKYLFRGIERVLLSSATLTTMDLQYLGLESDMFDLFDIESGFAAERRPFIYWPTVPIDWQMVEGQFRQVMNRIDKLIDVNSALGYRGVIHSRSYDYAERIVSGSRHNLISHNSRNAQTIIQGWLKSEGPSTIVSPIMTEGIDLKDDLARYQIIWKVPMDDSRNPLTAARKKRDKRYTLYLAGKTIQQITGRVCRSFKDFGLTAILDKHWGNWMQNSIPWPKSFRQSWRTVRDVPEPIRF